MANTAPTRDDLLKLQAPFPAEDVEWRIGRSGKKDGGDFWAVALAYITNRAIMERLDEVCGPENWKNEFKEGPNGGIIAGISIRVQCPDSGSPEWVTKWDGADNTDVEAVKGGLSNAMKRAGVQWGIGRYLYNLTESFVETSVTKQEGTKYAKTKEGKFFWFEPDLPAWALPQDFKAKLSFIAAHMERLEDDTVGMVGGAPVKLKNFIVKRGAELKTDYKLASQVVLALEKRLQVRFDPTE